MQLPASMNIAPPPLMRRTTVMPCRDTPSGCTSLRYDWKLPITTDGSSQSQKRMVGLRRPAPTSSVRTSSSATCRCVGSTLGAMMFQWWSVHAVALATARRTAMATASAENPNSTVSSGREASTAAAISAAVELSGSPFKAALLARRASSGSRKKSPLRETSVKAPSSTSRSTTTSLPPGTLYSPCSGGVDSSIAEPGVAVMPSILPHKREKPAPLPVRAFQRTLGRSELLLAAEALEASVEALDAASGVHDALLARVERVGLGGDFDVDDRVGVAVFPLDGLRGRHGGLGQELGTGGQVIENDGGVLRVDIRLHNGAFVRAAGFCQLPGMNGMAAICRISRSRKSRTTSYQS